MMVSFSLGWSEKYGQTFVGGNAANSGVAGSGGGLGNNQPICTLDQYRYLFETSMWPL